jgi:hypothetical protein
LSESASTDHTSRLRIKSSDAANYLMHNVTNLRTLNQTSLSPYLEGLTFSMAPMKLLQLMSGDILVPFRTPKPNSQTYCLVASALQHENQCTKGVAWELFQNATRSNISVDGRFVNAVFRCFGSDIDEALNAWKGEIRQQCLSSNGKSKKESTQQQESKTLLAAYHGLLYVCGRALRPDIALRIVYAMNKEKGVIVNEMALQCYQSGKRKALSDSNSSTSKSAVALGEQFESLLIVECTTYDTNDKRRQGDRRVRIIL